MTPDYIRQLRADRAYLRRTLRKVYGRVSAARFKEYPGPQLYEALELAKEALEWTRVIRSPTGNRYLPRMPRSLRTSAGR